MPQRENVSCGIDVAVMVRTAHLTDPFSYSQTFPAFRAGAAVTRATGLGGIYLIDFLEPDSVRHRLVAELGSEHRPAGIQHGLGHAGLCQLGAAHVADEDGSMLVRFGSINWLSDYFSLFLLPLA